MDVKDYGEMLVGHNSQGEAITLKMLQKRQLGILKDVSKALEKNSVDYFLAYGTMLGAIRHKGFIPWDDDIDICIFLDDYDRCIEVLQKELDDSEYVVHSFETNNKYNVCINPIKVRLKNTYALEPFHFAPNDCGNDGIFIDIFIVHNVSGNKKVDLLYRSVSAAAMILNFIPINLHIHSNFLKKLYINSYKWYHKKMKDSGYIGFSAYSLYSPPICLPEDVYYPLKKIKFEDDDFLCINNPDSFLTARYGDYMKEVGDAQKRLRHASKHIDL